MVAIRYNSVISKFYSRLVADGKPKMTAVVASMRNLLVILNCMVKKKVMGTKNCLTFITVATEL